MGSPISTEGEKTMRESTLAILLLSLGCLLSMAYGGAEKLTPVTAKLSSTSFPHFAATVCIDGELKARHKLCHSKKEEKQWQRVARLWAPLRDLRLRLTARLANGWHGANALRLAVMETRGEQGRSSNNQGTEELSAQIWRKQTGAILQDAQAILGLQMEGVVNICCRMDNQGNVTLMVNGRVVQIVAGVATLPTIAIVLNASTTDQVQRS